MAKMLVVTPRFPFEAKGACEQDRAWGIRRLGELGHDVQVITKCLPGDLSIVVDAEQFAEAKITPVLYKKYQPCARGERRARLMKRLTHPLYLDGAAFEYTDPEIMRALDRTLGIFKPDLVWFDYTYLWPLYGEVCRRGLPIITRSINFEPRHFLEEDGRTLINYLKYLPKLGSEYRSIRQSDVVLSITSDEERVYKKMRAPYVMNLPLRGLPRVLKSSHEIRDRKPLKVFFMGSTYNVVHNREALLYIVRDIAPRTLKEAPGAFTFHILGSKVPESVRPFFTDSVIDEGPKYGEALESFLADCDIALIPSLMGAGMQQKIFEPLARGIPTLTSARGLAGYPFVSGESVLTADSPENFVNSLISLRDTALRRELSANSIRIAHDIFGQEKIDAIVQNAIQTALTI